MARLEDLTRGAAVKGILPDCLVTVVDIKWHGNTVVELTYKDSSGHLGSQLLFRDNEPALEIVTKGQPWSFDADGRMFRLVSEAKRIRLAYLFDPYLAVHTSLVEPLPHQITAVYGEMLKRQPLRFLLADDPGAGKTIMTGLFIKELLIRGDLYRCLIVCPGNLVEQWQDELVRKFSLPFEILTNERIEAARTGNVFNELSLCIARLDKLARDEDLQLKLQQSDWDLIVVDEAHKMSASFFGGEVKYTKRYRLGQLLSRITRHFLLLTATPHNGKEEDFQLFMALLDGDRFEGRFRDGVHTVDTSDLMRRMVKEELLKFDGRPLFPERIAYTVNYTLSDMEAYLYKEVTDYVREEFNRADALENEGRKGTVGFALTILQRRLASSPEAIYQSLKRRRERLEKRLQEEELFKRGATIALKAKDMPVLTEEDIDDLDDAPETELTEAENLVVDQATAARTIQELRAEIEELKRLEKIAYKVKVSGTDRKWEELSQLLQDNARMFDAQGYRLKLVIFTEHRDTLNYLAERIRNLLGKQEAVVTIHGGMGREERKKVQEAFTQDKDVLILIATDAAGEGINLQRAHLMVNYDLPWNPNRLEQRFGRIHRIGQTEVCHLWNLVAAETREGEVFHRLFQKLEEERKALGGRVFDVLGKVTFANRSLKDLLIEAIRYGEQPEVRARLNQVVENALNHEALQQLLEERALARDTMDVTKVREIKEEMERAEARRLQPHFIASFFIEAFKLLGGSLREREPKRYEITHVPAVIRNRDRQIGIGEPVLPRYERVCFEKDLINLPGKPVAAFLCPGHPLLEATIDLILERNRGLLKRGAVLINPDDNGEDIRALFYIEHAIQDARTDPAGNRRIVSRQLQFVEIDKEGRAFNAGYAPYLDYRPATEAETELVTPLLAENWLQGDIEARALSYAITELVPKHFTEVKNRKEEMVLKTMAAVKDRLTKEINYWDHRAEELKAQEQAGKINARINSEKARQRADDLAARLKKRLEELEQERHLSPLPPVVTGGALVVPQGLINRLKGEGDREASLFARETKRIEQMAMQAVMSLERQLGFEPRDVSAEKCGYDIESRLPGTGKLRFIEVKGRLKGATTVTVTKNEILTALNKPEDYILAIVEVDGDNARPVYIRCPFRREPEFAVTSINYNITDLMAAGEVLYGNRNAG
ncbi:helicase-related protein [Neomoorella thermoacetica]|uniref:helicase-related protein n=1 Tax=Neomoorella thermoacetica TaxID=1525 RepID=UPI0030CD2BFC